MTNKLLKQALQIAYTELSAHSEYRHYMHWTFVVQANKIIEWGTNRKGQPHKYFGYHGSAKIHSELNAYKKARGLLGTAEFEIINVRISREKKLKISAPCCVCRSWLESVGCTKAWFTLSDEGWGNCLTQERTL